EAVDCGHFLIESFARPGALPRVEPGKYPQYYFLHHEEELFLDWVLRWGGVEIPTSQARPGDILCYKIGKCYAHGAILLDPLHVIHAYVCGCAKVTITETFDSSLLKWKPRAFDMFAQRRA